jgi:hypothetical protein
VYCASLFTGVTAKGAVIPIDTNRIPLTSIHIHILGKTDTLANTCIDSTFVNTLWAAVAQKTGK